MKLDKFILQVEEYKRNEKHFSIRLLSIMFLLIFGNLLFIFFNNSPKLEDNSVFWILYTIIFIMILFGNMIYVLKRAKKKILQFDFLCPNCKKHFNEREFPLIISTSNCPHCGKKILTD